MIHHLLPFSKLNSSLDLTASCVFDSQNIILTYKLSPISKDISLPEQSCSEREIGLWRSTCFEFFLVSKRSRSYYEFNFSPSGKWNCFYFNKSGDELRESSCIINKLQAKRIKNSFQLDVHIALDSLKDEFQNEDEFLLNLTAVLEELDLSYWAFEHGESGPNFHDFEYYREIKKSGNKPKPVT